MSNLEAFLRFDPTPLGAQAAMALSIVMAPLNPVVAIELKDHANFLAVCVGENAKSDDLPPALAVHP